MQLTVRIQLKPSPLLQELTVCAKNLYNRANYLVRQNFFATGTWLGYAELYRRLKTEECYVQFHSCAGYDPPQQTLRTLEHNWRAFFKSLKAWKKEPSQFLGRPKPPRYLKKTHGTLVSWERRQGRFKEGHWSSTKKLTQHGFPIIPLANLPVTKTNFKGYRLIPWYNRFVLELIYTQEPPSPNKNPKKFLGLDLGVNNLVASSDGLLVKGGILKALNQYFNKQLASWCSYLTKKQQSVTTHRVQRLLARRANQLDALLHKASRLIIQHCLTQKVEGIVLGYNPRWKQQLNLGKITNQNFVFIPFLKFVHQLEYKARLAGIQVYRVTEEYTSQRCSYCSVVSKKNRKHRGLYVCRACGVTINADINAARNILAKYLVTTYLPTQATNVHSPYSKDVQAFLRRQGISGGVTPPVCLALQS